MPYKNKVKNKAKPRMHRALAQLAMLGIGLISATELLAQSAGSESNLKISGYVGLVAGRVLSGTLNADYVGPDTIKHIGCPCYVADWSNGGVYGNEYSLLPESRAGIQLQYALGPRTGLTAQLVSRGTNGMPDVAWAYGSHKFNENFEVQVGRKRIPLYYYSDFQDIGVSYPWVTPPPELYGWDVTNFNGASLRYNRNMGNTNLSASVFGGREHANESPFQKLYYPAGSTEVQWNNLMGADVEANNGPLTVRAVFMQADVKTINNHPANLVDDTAALQAYGVAINLDFDNWFMLSEFTQLTRDHTLSQYKVTAPAMTIGAGLRLGKWTPFINFAKYTEETTDLSQYAPGSYKRASVTLRYDLGSSSAIKGQFDKNFDTTNNFGGDAAVFRVSYDRVF